jgi:hypothetical protein
MYRWAGMRNNQVDNRKADEQGWYWYRKDKKQNQLLMDAREIGEQTTAWWPSGRSDINIPGERARALARPVPQCAGQLGFSAPLV